MQHLFGFSLSCLAASFNHVVAGFPCSIYSSSSSSYGRSTLARHADGGERLAHTDGAPTVEEVRGLGVGDALALLGRASRRRQGLRM